MGSPGWRVKIWCKAHKRCRMEAFHDESGTVIQITSNWSVTDARWKTPHFYVLFPSARAGDGRRWREVRPEAVQIILGNPTSRSAVQGLIKNIKVTHLACKCMNGASPKRKFRVESEAQEIILAAKIHTAVNHGRIPVRAYRCESDDRVWHVTSRE